MVSIELFWNQDFGYFEGLICWRDLYGNRCWYFVLIKAKLINEIFRREQRCPIQQPSQFSHFCRDGVSDIQLMWDQEECKNLLWLAAHINWAAEGKGCLDRVPAVSVILMVFIIIYESGNHGPLRRSLIRFNKPTGHFHYFSSLHNTKL